EELNRLPKIQRVHYPGLPQHPQHQLARRQMPAGFGAMLSLELDCGAEEAESVCQATRIWTNATSLGSVESLLERRARWAGDDYLPPGLLRLSVGIEDKEDLLSDLVQALERLSPEEEPSAAVPPPAG
ncbi:MAG: PLP-dependent transferase, partial [Candidatus Dormibacteria bacterium]